MYARYAFVLIFTLSLSVGCGAPTGGSQHESGIILEQIATIPPGERTSLYGPKVLAFDSQGRIAIAGSDMNDGVPFVTDLKGRMVKLLGRRGQGPGEFIDVTAILVDAFDSLFVIDKGNAARVSVFDPDLNLVRSYPIDSRVRGSAHRFPNGNWLFASGRFSGPPLLLIDANGRLLAAWGDSVDYVEPANGMEHRFHWIIGPGLEDRAWAARSSGQFEILGFDSRGKQGIRLTPEVDWFDPYEMPEMPSRSKPPQARVVNVWEDEAGLWVIGAAADERWKESLGEEYRIEGRTANRIVDPVLYGDVVIELREPGTGELKARRRLDEILLPSWAGARDLLIDRTEDDIGFEGFDLYRVRFSEAD
jgi:hypothetical protein